MAAMEELSGFQRALAEHRERYNGQFRLARHRHRSLDPQAFLAHLRDAVAPVVAAAGGDSVAVTDALVDLSLELAGRGRLASPAAADAFTLLLPALGPFVGAEPRRVPVAVVNALHHLESAPSGRAGEWMDAVLALASVARDAGELLDAAAVAAWRCGLAQLRASALATAATVRPELVRIAAGTTDIATLAGDPWASPGGTVGLRLVRRAGGFRGFGGVFARPPRVFTSDGCWYAGDGDCAWRVYADRFGESFRRVATLPSTKDTGGRLSLAKGKVRDTAGDAVLEVPELADVTSWAACGSTLAATTPWTHGILFVARTAG